MGKGKGKVTEQWGRILWFTIPIKWVKLHTMQTPNVLED